MSLHNNKTWILAADSAKAKIYNWDPISKNIHNIISLQEDDARKKEQELRADRPGHGEGFNSNVQYTVDEHISYKKQASHLFLHKIAKFLSDKDNIPDYDDLIIIAPDDTYKQIEKDMSKTAKNKIKKHHAKNVTNMPIADLMYYYATTIA